MCNCKKGCSRCCNHYLTGTGWHNKPVTIEDKISNLDSRIEMLIGEKKNLLLEYKKLEIAEKLRKKALSKLTVAEKEALGLN